MPSRPGESKQFRKRSAFTLIEVILAILIISGIMTVLLYFYQRAANVRQAALQEVEFLSVSRMFLEQISSELRTARVVEDQFTALEGSSNSITFVCTSLPQMARWIASTNEPVILPPATDLKRVSYWLLGGTNENTGTEQPTARVGVDRSEELLLGAGFTAGTNSTEFIDPDATNEVDAAVTSSATTNLFEMPDPPLTARIGYLQFRYWDGTNWVDEWSGMELPGGVEISLGREPAPVESPEEEYPYELFRRVVYLPFSEHRGNQVVIDPPMEEFAF